MENLGVWGLMALLLTASFFMIAIMIPTGTESKVETLPLWYTQAPFGELYADVSGSFVWGSGHINTSPSEAYSVKYWKDNQLQSLVLDATKTPIVVDNTFTLIKTENWRVNVFGWGSPNEESATYVLHLPSLPQNVSVGMLSP